MASSSTSSWISVAVWIISTAAASSGCSGSSPPHALPERSTNAGRSRLPPKPKAVLDQPVDERMPAGQLLVEDLLDLGRAPSRIGA